MKKRLLTLFLLTIPCVVIAQDSLREALRGQVFTEARQALAQANAAGASALAPETYRSGAAAFKKAESLFNDGADLKRVRERTDAATLAFGRAAQLATTVKEFIGPAYQARLDAEGASARVRAADLWEKAELQFYEAASRAERGRESRVARYADKAEALYREAELAAIENALFAEIQREIDAAYALDADDWAPKSYGFAVDLLSQARSELAANRYDTDRPRGLANEALHYARHAQYVSRLADDIDDDDVMLEDVLFDWERAIQALAVDLDQPVYFDAGPAEALQQLRNVVAERASLQSATAEQLADTQGRAAVLEQELLQLQVALEGEEEAKARLDARLAAEEQRIARFKRVENSFAPEEAQVLREQNRLLIRLVGLSFTSGSANIEARHYPVLAKLQRVIAEFPDAPITIEGHTDSHGVDATNMQLSVARAEAVAGYLLANTAVSPSQISSLGFGEDRPIANNETVEGRARNRRIDVVIYP